MHADFAPPSEVAIRSVLANGVPSLALVPESRPLTLLYLHGGGFGLFRHLAGALAVEAGAGALVPDYRLAPEHPFPAALDDAVRAYRYLLDAGEGPLTVREPPRRMFREARAFVAADSSGGGLALALLLRARSEGLPLPARVVLFCPGVDPTFASVEEAEDEAAEAILAAGRRFTAAYLDGHPIDDPLDSPLLGDLTGLPPLLIQAADGDLAAGDAYALAARRRARDARDLLHHDARVPDVLDVPARGRRGPATRRGSSSRGANRRRALLCRTWTLSTRSPPTCGSGCSRARVRMTVTCPAGSARWWIARRGC